MANKKLSKSTASKFLGFLWRKQESTVEDFLAESKKLAGKSRKFWMDTVGQLERSGALEEVSRITAGRRVIRKFKLTPRGMLRAANLNIIKKRLQKLPRERRLIVFDIPEDDRLYRDYFRQLMKDLGCEMIQLSVWQADFELPEDFLMLVKELGLEHRVIVYKVKPEDTIYL